MRPAISSMLDHFDRWAQQGWWRRLDSALPHFVARLDPEASPALLAATAVLVCMEGKGHTCLALNELAHPPADLLGWPADRRESLVEVWAGLPSTPDGWVAEIATSCAVHVHHAPLSMVTTRDADGTRPLVLDLNGEVPRFYLRRYWAHEQSIASAIRDRTETPLPVETTRARAWLDLLFGEASRRTDPSQGPDWQKIACAVALRGRFTIVTGGPGTGKTYTAARLLGLLFALDPEPERLRVALAAPTGKAAARLKQSIDGSLAELATKLAGRLDLAQLTARMGAARTLHALLGATPDSRGFRYDARHPLDLDVLIVDEASMVHMEMMAALLDALPAGARLILLGDKDQLSSVEAGAVLGDLCRGAASGNYNADTVGYLEDTTGERVPEDYRAPADRATPIAQHTVMLRESRRFGGPIGQLAIAVNQGDVHRARQILNAAKDGTVELQEGRPASQLVELAVRGRSSAGQCYADYLHLVKERPRSVRTDPDAHAAWVKAVLRAFDRFRVLCAVHEGEWGTKSLNRAIRTALAGAKLVPESGEWYAGRPVMVLRNDRDLGVSNGDVGIALPGLGQAPVPRVYFLDGETLRSVSVSRLAHVETAFAMTVHKSQGSEFAHVALALPPGAGEYLTRELVYTGITRARERLTLFDSGEGVLDAAISRRTQRASGLDQG